MQYLEPLDAIPHDIWTDFRCELHKTTPTDEGAFRLVKIRRTFGGYEDGRLIVMVVDENGFALPGVKIAFSFSSANPFGTDEKFKWYPPSLGFGHRADIFPTEGGGQIEHVQDKPIKEGLPGGITTYVIEPEYSSDYVTGCGMLADHTGLHMTFQLRRTGVLPIYEWMAVIEARLSALEV